MAIPNNYIDKINKEGDSRMICPAADKVRVENQNFVSDDLDGALNELAGGKANKDETYTKEEVNDKVPLRIAAIKNGDVITSTTDYGEIANAVKEDWRDAYVVVNNESIFNFYQVGQNAIIFTRVDAEDGTQAYLAVSSNNVWSIEYSAISGGGEGTVTGVKIGETTYTPTEGVVDISTPISNKVDKVTGYGLSKNDYTDAEKTKLADLPTNPVTSISVNGGAAQTPSNGNVNLVVETGGETVVINSDGANIVDEHSNNSVLVAPSARQMKLMYDNVMSIFNGLANTAFTNGKPTLDWVGTKTKYTLAYGTMTGCTADVSAGQVNEGALRIKLTPTQSSYAFTQVLVNGESASTTATGDADGSVYLDIVVNGNITVAATAISGRGIDFTASTGCTIDDAGVAIGEDLDTTIRATEHYTLPASITVQIGNTDITHTYTKAQDGKTATLHIDAANITGDLTITCTSVEDAHVTLSITGSNYVVKNGTETLANGSKVYNGSAAVTLTIEPASGYRFSTLPTSTQGTMTNNGAYAASSLVIGTSATGTVSILASATELHTFNITLPSSTKIDNTNNAVTVVEGSEYSNTLSLNSTAEEGEVLSNITATMEGGGTISVNGNTINTSLVTGAITISATVVEAGRFTISLPSAEHIVVKGSDNATVIKAADNTSPTNPKVADSGSESWSGYISAEEVVIPSNVYSSTTVTYELSNVKVLMASNGTNIDITDDVLDRSNGKITINAVTGDVTIIADAIAFTEARYVNSSGNITGASSSHIDFCVSNIIPLPELPTGKSWSKVVIDFGGSIGSNSYSYGGWYGESGFISQFQEQTTYRERYKVFTVPEAATGLRVLFKSDVTNGRDNSIRRKHYVLGIDNDGDTYYIYRGLGYDGRYEDEYEMEFGQGVTNIGTGAITSYTNGTPPSCTKLLDIPSNISSGELTCVLGRKNTFSTKFSNIAFYDSSDAYIANSAVVTSTDMGVTTVSVPSGAVKLRLTTTNPDEAYIKYTDSSDNETKYIYKGVFVTDNN